VKHLLLLMTLLTALACSGDSGSGGAFPPACGVDAEPANRFGYLTCTVDENPAPPEEPPDLGVIECPSFCPGVALVCMTRCLDGNLANGPQWACPCDGNPCWRVVAGVLRSCPGCGDGVREGDEECDDKDLGGMTCMDRGCTGGGVLACSASCTFDESGCTGCPAP
jgi:hypothetical protein